MTSQTKKPYFDPCILKKQGDPEQTPEAPHIENFAFQRQIHLLLQISFC